MKSVELKDNKLYVRFTFDPYILKNVKTLLGRIYNKNLNNTWIMPITRLSTRKLREWGFNVPRVKREVKDVDISNSIRDIPLFRYQKKGVQKIVNTFFSGKKGFLLADDMGIGKTIQAITVIKHFQYKKVLIVCPASLKLNWQREIKKWVNFESYIVNSSESNEYDIKNNNMLIINYDILKKFESILKNIKFDMVISDECHYIKNEQAQRTKSFKNIIEKTDKILLLSGTPIENRPIEFFNTLNIINSDLFSNKFQFGQRYCALKNNGFGYDWSGHSNTGELNQLLVEEDIMLRRKKEDILEDLPDKLVSVIPLDIDNYSEYALADKEFALWLKNNKQAKRTQIQFNVEELEQIVLQGKIKQIYSWIDNFFESNEKLVLMCKHHKTIDLLYERYKDVSVLFDGRCNEKQKQQAVDQFQNSDKIKLFIGNIKAAGVGITLTAASNLCFLQLDWSPSKHDQASDRIYRIGQKNCCNIYYFVAQGTIEEAKLQLLDRKRKVVKAILDGERVQDFNILSELLRKYEV